MRDLLARLKRAEAKARAAHARAAKCAQERQRLSDESLWLHALLLSHGISVERETPA
jgi:hypothetical protein